jgi:hypothetical protein
MQAFHSAMSRGSAVRAAESVVLWLDVKLWM